MRKAEYKIPGGKLIAVELVLINGVLGSVKLYGDFFMHPEESIIELEKRLEGINQKEIEKSVKDFFDTHEITLFGIKPEDFIHVIETALQN